MPEAHLKTALPEPPPQNATEHRAPARLALAVLGAGLVGYGLLRRRRAGAKVSALPRAGQRPFQFSFTVQRPIEETARAWRNPAVEMGTSGVDERLTHRLTIFRPELIEYEAGADSFCEWHLADDPGLRGRVTFEPLGQEATRVCVQVTNLRHQTRLKAAAKHLLFHSLTQEVRADCYRMKQLLETGEIATTAGQSVGVC